jgi:5-methyltetrahydrofolate--homocysteine methyltransferase
VIIGGAAINRAFGYRALFPEEGRPYAPGVFYCKDAFEGLESMDRLVDPEQRDGFLARVQEEAERSLRAPVAAAPNLADASVRSATRLDVPIPTPPFWGWRTVEDAPLAEVFECMDLNTLYRLHWGGKVHGEAFERLVREDFAPRLERMQREAIAGGWLTPRAIYGYFPCNAEGNDLVIYDPADHAREVTRLRFPRRPDRDRICVADYFQPRESGRRDVIALQVVTVGARASELLAEMQARGEYSEVLFVHGLAMEAVEGLAEWLNRRVRRELELPGTTGLRYSWGYPACPDLDEQAKLEALMPVRELIGVGLTESFQWDPEATTAAFVVHHPDAKYFSVRPSESPSPESGVRSPVS